MRRRGGGADVPSLGGGGADHASHVSLNMQQETVRTRGMGSAGTTSAAAAAAGRAVPLEKLLNDAGGSKHAEVLRYLKRQVDEEKREFSKLQQDVFDSLTEHEVMEASFDRQFEAQQTFGGQAADYVAAVGGSWRFVFFFLFFMVGWAVFNSFTAVAWDPYPFILLNLFLSCISAFQSPVILMSQNRQVQRDRGQSDYTARVNLRAELVSRHINAKLDAFISTAWRRLYESQAIQTSMVERLLELERQQMALVKALSRAQARARAASRDDVGGGAGDEPGPPLGSHGGGSEQPGLLGLSTSLPYRAFGRRMSEEALEFPAFQQQLGPGTVLQVYDDDDDDDDDDGDDGTRVAGKGGGGGGDDGEEYGAMEGLGAEERAAAAAATAGGPASPTQGPASAVGMRDSSSLVVQTSPAAGGAMTLAPSAFSIYSTPLAALCVAPPAARGLRALDLPWLLETEEDPHTIFLMRTMLRALAGNQQRPPPFSPGPPGDDDGGGGGGGSGLWDDGERMIFEHRSVGDNFSGNVNGVHIQSRDPSLATRGVVCTVASLGSPLRQTSRGRSPMLLGDEADEDLTGTRGRRVAPAFVSRVVEAASLVDTGGGAEPWFPFDVAYDLSFPGAGAALDSLLAGDAILTLRNALDLPFQTSMGEIRSMTLHPRGCPCSRLCADAAAMAAMATVGAAGVGDGGGARAQVTVTSALTEPSLSRAMSACAGAITVRQGEIPPRFKPSLSQDRDDRISDFWKMPLSRVQISYSPAPIFACVTLRSGQAVVPLSVEFLSHARQQHPPPHLPTSGASGAGSGESTPQQSMSRQGSGRGAGLFAPLTRNSSGNLNLLSQAAMVARSKSPMPLGEGPDPAPMPPMRGAIGSTSGSSSSLASGGIPGGLQAQAAAIAAAGDRGSIGSSAGGGSGNTLTRAHAASLKKVVELWHGRHHPQAQAQAQQGGAGVERVSTPDLLGEGMAAALLRETSGAGSEEGEDGGRRRPGKELLAIINPSAESLCEALAYGVQWTRSSSGSRVRRVGSGRSRGRGEPLAEGGGGAAGAGGNGGADNGNDNDNDNANADDDADDGAVPLHLDALPPAALDDLPHNRWLALPLHKAPEAGGGGSTTTYEIDMPLIPGPAVIFFFSPLGRLRLRGVLRDDGAEAIMEMD